MPSLQKIEEIKKLLDGSTTYTTLQAEANARYILYGVKEDEANFPRFDAKLTTKTQSLAFLYLEMACTYIRERKSAEAILHFEKCAMLLEYNNANSLDRDEKDEMADFSLMVSGLAYYCACQYSKAYVVITKCSYDTPFTRMVSCFLKRKFEELEYEIKETLLLERNGKKAFADVYDILLARALSLVLCYYHYGSEAVLARSEDILKDGTRIALLGDDPAVWWEFRLMEIIVKQLHKTSLWATLKDNESFSVDDNGLKALLNQYPSLLEWLPYAPDYWERSAKGIVSNYIYSLTYKNHPVTELFVSQRTALEKVLRHEGAVISMPTSSGKTRIAELAILQALMQNGGAKVLYIAPYRSLSYEMEETIGTTFRPLNYTVTHLYGGAQFTAIDRGEMENARVLIATPEKAKAILRTNDEVVGSIKMVVMDEGHLLGKDDREVVNEMFTEELRRIVSQNGGRFLVLSAVLPNAKDMASWLTGGEENAVVSDWRPSSQRLGLLCYHKKRIDIEWIGDFPCFNNSFVTGTGDKKTLVARAAIKLSALGSVLIYCSRADWIMAHARVMLGLVVDTPEVNWGDDLDWQRFKLACQETKDDGEYVEMAKKGILCHHGRMKHDVRRFMEKLLRKGKARFIYATNTLAQGVNLGVSTVIVFSVIQGKQKTLSKRDFWNMAGRAGRSYIDTEGKILFLCDCESNEKYHRGEANKYVRSLNDEKAESGLYLNLSKLCEVQRKTEMDFDYLLELIAENKVEDLPQEDGYDWVKFFELIDDSLMALDLENNDDDDLRWVEEQFRSSLAMIQEENAAQREEYLQIIKSRVRAVRKIAGGSSMPQAFASSGIPLKVALYLEDHISDLVVMAEDYLGGDEGIDRVLDFFVQFDEMMGSISSARISMPQIEELDNIREAWFSGESMGYDEMNKAEKYYGFTASWLLNAVACRFAAIEQDDYRWVYEEMALLAENGLPSRWAVQIYLSGISSRRVAREISEKLVQPYEMTRLSEVASYMLDSVNSIVNGGYSELAKEWVSTLGKGNSVAVRKVEKTKNFFFGEDEVNVPEVLYCKTFQNRIYLCSDDMTYKRSVLTSDGLPFDKVADIDGVRFVKSGNIWMMENVNPYVELVE